MGWQVIVEADQRLIQGVYHVNPGPGRGAPGPAHPGLDGECFNGHMAAQLAILYRCWFELILFPNLLFILGYIWPDSN